MKLLFAYVMWLLIQLGAIPASSWAFPNHALPECQGFALQAGGATCNNIPAWVVFKAQITADPGPSRMAAAPQDGQDAGEDGTTSISNGF